MLGTQTRGPIQPSPAAEQLEQREHCRYRDVARRRHAPSARVASSSDDGDGAGGGNTSKQTTAVNLAEFDRELRALVSQDARPFLCEGNPFDCRVFLVGLNPKTHTDFWQFWDTTNGCSKSKWLDAYMAKEKKLSRTRKYIELLLTTLAPVKRLETNLFDAWSHRLADLPKENRRTKVFDFLLGQIEPDVIFVHGCPVVDHLG